MILDEEESSWREVYVTSNPAEVARQISKWEALWYAVATEEVEPAQYVSQYRPFAFL
ncbi:hypothetical protein ACR6C2_17025 [Streptomyces sp. INA 01156]